MQNIINFFILSLLSVVILSCAGMAAKPVVQEQPAPNKIADAQVNAKSLGNASSSVDELCKEVLAKLAQNDIKALEAMALTEDEFKKYYWPHSEWSRPEVRMPFEYFWSDLNQKSSNALKGTLARFGGKNLQMVGIRFAKETMQYQEARVYRNPTLTVRDEEGQEQEVQLFGGIFELNGDYKIYTYRYK